MNDYCLVKNCLKEHCLYGKQGEKKMHLLDCTKKGIRHCPVCNSHKKDVGGFCSVKCQDVYWPRGIKRTGKKSIAEIQQVMSSWAGNPNLIEEVHVQLPYKD